MEKMIPEVLRGNPYPVYCPVCQANIDHNNSNGFTCLNGHQFNQAAAGFINLLNRAPYSIYTEQLFRASRELLVNGFFDVLERKMLQLLYREYAVNDSLTILDAGTGEGTLFSNILLCMHWDQYRHQGIGIDHCITAVRSAAQHYKQALWLVADIDELPVKAQSIDVILNTLAPANYEEFLRILQPGGLLIKTVPGPGHLQELRSPARGNAHGNEQPESMFRRNMELVQQLRLQYQKKLREDEKILVMKMASMAGIECDQSMIKQLSTISIDLIMLCGRKPY